MVGYFDIRNAEIEYLDAGGGKGVIGEKLDAIRVPLPGQAVSGGWDIVVCNQVFISCGFEFFDAVGFGEQVEVAADDGR